MLKIAIILFVVSLIAGALGFTGVAGASAGLAKIAFGIFLFLALAVLVMIALGVKWVT